MSVNQQANNRREGEDVHGVLLDQVTRHFGGLDRVPPGWLPFVQEVAAAYERADADRADMRRLLERSAMDLHQATADLWRVFRLLPDRFFRVDGQGVILDASACRQQAGAPGEGASLDCIGRHLSTVTGDVVGMMLQRAAEEVIASGQRTVLKFAGEGGESGRFIEAIALPLAGAQAVLFLRDVTREARLEAQLRQAQKMEAIGLLAGGIAHDFNNLLTVILGNLELLAARAGRDGAADLDTMRRATERGVSLVSQLLAFSRRQVLHPRVLNLNDSVEQTAKLLRRLIGENIRVETSLAPGAGSVCVDPVQMEQVVMNLAVNARDAMPDGGVLTFATDNVTTNDDGNAGDVELPPGEYVSLSVTDTGTGMTPEILAHLFEPFFTTKEAGKGTGLGLATVYGIVRQSGGFVTVASEPRRGTTFRILLPRVHAGDTSHGGQNAAGATHAELHGAETVLLVEDEEPIRSLCGKILNRYGYRVLSAGSGEEALGLIARKPVFVHLLVTDVIMPGMHGGELARRIVRQRPGIRVLYMSGHPDETLARHGIDADGANYLPKPFHGLDLIRKVRALLDATPRLG